MQSQKTFQHIILQNQTTVELNNIKHDAKIHIEKQICINTQENMEKEQLFVCVCKVDLPDSQTYYKTYIIKRVLLVH